MKTCKFLSLLAFLLLAGVGSAWAHGRSHVGIYFGPYWGPGPWYYAPPPYYYRPEVVVLPAPQPTVYVEQQPAAPAAPVETTPRASEQYWYYCAASKGYYPYVKECPGGWQKVQPHPEK
jgi:hypothetical protein